MHIIQYDCTAIGGRYVARLQPKLGSGGTVATLGGELARNARRHPDRPALIFDHTERTYVRCLCCLGDGRPHDPSMGTAEHSLGQPQPDSCRQARQPTSCSSRRGISLTCGVSVDWYELILGELPLSVTQRRRTLREPAAPSPAARMLAAKRRAWPCFYTGIWTRPQCPDQRGGGAASVRSVWWANLTPGSPGRCGPTPPGSRVVDSIGRAGPGGRSIRPRSQDGRSRGAAVAHARQHLDVAISEGVYAGG